MLKVTNDLSISDFRLSHEDGFVEDEVEVRGVESTLRGGQESYHGRVSITIVAQRSKQGSRYRYSSQSWCVAFFRTGG